MDNLHIRFNIAYCKSLGLFTEKRNDSIIVYLVHPSEEYYTFINYSNTKIIYTFEAWRLIASRIQHDDFFFDQKVKFFHQENEMDILSSSPGIFVNSF